MKSLKRSAQMVKKISIVDPGLDGGNNCPGLFRSVQVVDNSTRRTGLKSDRASLSMKKSQFAKRIYLEKFR